MTAGRKMEVSASGRRLENHDVCNHEERVG